MADLSRVKEHMEVIGADGVHVGTVDSVSGNRIKLIKADSGSHGHHHYVSAGLVADIEGNQVRLSANGANAALLEEEEDGSGLGEQGLFTWRNIGIGAAAAGVAAAAAMGARALFRGNGGNDGGSSNGGKSRSSSSKRSRSKTEA
jgi:hypothetical protein